MSDSSIGSSGSVSSGSVSSGSVSSGSNIRLAPIYVLTQSDLDSIIKSKNHFPIPIPVPVPWNGRKPIKNEILYFINFQIFLTTYSTICFNEYFYVYL